MGILKKQRGMSALGILFVTIFAGILAVLLIRVAPVITEYKTISRVVRFAAASPDPNQVRATYSTQIGMEGVSSPTVTPDKLNITPMGSGSLVRFTYEREIPLFGPVSLVFRFEGEESGTSY